MTEQGGTRVVIDCRAGVSVEEILKEFARRESRCKILTAETARAMISSGAVSSERQAARVIAEQTGEKENTVRQRIKRGKKMGTPVPTDKKSRQQKQPSSWADHHNLYSEYLRCIREEISDLSSMPEWKDHKVRILNEVKDLVYFIHNKG